MKNKKGFTIVELGVSICLVTVVSFLLFQMIVTVKKIYAATDVKTTLLTKQAIMTNKIYDDFDSKTLLMISNCSGVWQNSCVEFTFADRTTSTLMVDPLRNTITYNNYAINYDDIDDTISFGDLVYNNSNNVLSIKIPVISKSIDGDYGIKIVKQYNYLSGGLIDNYSTINVPLSDTVSTTITFDGTNYWMRVYEDGNEELNSFMTKYLKRLKTTPCSDSSFAEKSYELRNNTNGYRWCQSNNFYTQGVLNATFKSIVGYQASAIGKDTYVSSLNGSTLDLRIDNFVNSYTFKAR